jgi:2-dehydro-3-deoxygluconokinase
VVLRRDEEGSRALVEGKPFEQQAFSITEVDPVGAGDAFVAGYLVGHIWELGPKKRLRVANAMSSYSVRPLGAYEGLPDREELEAFLSGEEELGR